MIKSEEGALPVHHGTWDRLSIPGTALPPCGLGWVIDSPPGAPHYSTSGHAYQKYGHVDGHFWLPQVSLSRIPTGSPLIMHVRTMGGTVGIAVGQAIYTSILKKKIDKIPGLSGFDTSSAALSQSVRTLQQLPVCPDVNL